MSPRRLQEDIEKQLAGRGVATDQEIFSVRLALEEAALVNAIKHGNQMERSKQGLHLPYQAF